MSLTDKYQQLLSLIRQYPSAAVAFSGGVDSTLLCKAAEDALGKKALAVTVLSPLIPEREFSLTEKNAKALGLRHKVIRMEELDPLVSSNPADRCYHCKKIIFTKILKAAEDEGITTVFDGSNVDDLSDYRPGLRALGEMNIISPLQQTGLTKDEIRQLSHQLKLNTWNLPAYACLASRIPYGTAITNENLTMVEKGEDYLQALGFRQIRLRHHGNLARIEIARNERIRLFDESLIDEISKELKKLGFTYVCMELEGYRMGSLNSELKKLEKGNKND